VAARQPDLGAEHITGKRKNNRAEGSHVPIRLSERNMQRFRSPGSAQRLLAAHAAVTNTFTMCRHLISAATHRQFRAEAFGA
jgi:putative transposase